MSKKKNPLRPNQRRNGFVLATNRGRGSCRGLVKGMKLSKRVCDGTDCAAEIGGVHPAIAEDDVKKLPAFSFHGGEHGRHVFGMRKFDGVLDLR